MWDYRIPLSKMLAVCSDWKVIATYIQGYGALGPIVLALLMVAQVFIAFIPGHALIIASGYVYGATLTIVVVATSMIVGSEIAFWLARRYGRPLISRFASPAMLAHWDRLAGNRGGAFYFFAFVLPFSPGDLMCYIAGLGKVPHKQFLAANVSGRLVFTIAMTWIGVYKLRPPLGFWLLFFAVLAALYIAWGIQNNSFKMLRAKVTCCLETAGLLMNRPSGKASQAHGSTCQQAGKLNILIQPAAPKETK